MNLKSKKDVKIATDLHNFGSIVKQSIVRADNAYITADNIEVAGSIITIKDKLNLVSHNNIKVIPIELFHRCSYHQGSKTTINESVIRKVISEINAGMINIDAGRVLEFVGALIEAEELNIKAKDLKISAAKEIFQKQIEFVGKKKWHGGRQSSSTWDYHEKLIPTTMSVGTLRMIVDHDSTIEASQIFVSENVLTRVGGNLVIKDGYELHIHDHHHKKYSLCSFGGGSMRFGHTKSVRDFTSEMVGMPTLVCSAGIFYGVVDGKMHVLGSKIIGKNIHIAVPNGLKLEASKYTNKSLIFVDETGSKLGFYCKNRQEIGVSAAAFSTQDEQEMWYEHLLKSSLVAQDSLTILVKEGTFEQISSDLAAKIIRVEARNWKSKTYDETIVSDHLHQHVESGVKVGVKQTVTAAFDKAKMLINKRGNHVIDHADRVFKAYDIYKSFASLPTSAATGGAYAYLEGSSTTTLSSYAIAVDNTISGETIISRIAQDINFNGVKMTAKDVDIEATNFIFETSSDRYDMEYDFGRIDVDIGLSNSALSSIGASVKTSSVSMTNHHNNYIKASGHLKITLSGDGKFKGVSLEGTEVDIKANNFILESVQDLVQKKISGADFHIGLGKEYNVSSFGAGVESGNEKSAWTNQVARIIGSSCVNIVVKETLEIASGLIASAEENKNGSLTDKGNLSINCAHLIIKTLHDYDDGLTLGVGASFQVNQQSSNNKNSVSFSHAPLKVEYKDNARNVSSVIGHGSINARSICGDEFSRNVNEQFTTTSKESASFDSVIHEDMTKTLTGDTKHCKRQPTVKEIVRAVSQENNLPTMLANYFLDVRDNFRGAIKDTTLSIADGAIALGSSLDRELVDQKIHQVFDWEYGTNLSSYEIRKLNEAFMRKYESLLSEIAKKRNIDLASDEGKLLASNEVKYRVFFNGLQESASRPEEFATVNVYKALYLKEVKNAKQEARAIKDFGFFVSEVTQSNIFTSKAFEDKVKDFIAHAIAKVELINHAASKSKIRDNDSSSTIAPKPIIQLKSIEGSEVPNLKCDKNEDDRLIPKEEMEIWNNNPKAKYGETKYAFVVLYDPGIKGEINDPENLKLDPTRIGHYYIARGEFDSEGNCVIKKQNIKGVNPKSQGWPLSKGEIKEEWKRYAKSIEYQKQKGTKVIKMRIIPVSEEQYRDISEFINSKPGLYFGGINDCYTFASNALTLLNIVNSRVHDIMKFNDNDRLTLARARDLGPVYGSNAQEVSEIYNVSLDRVTCGSAPYNIGEVCQIMPLRDTVDRRQNTGE